MGEPLNCFPKPGEICKEAGTFTPYNPMKVRFCASTLCAPPLAELPGLKAVATQGYTQNEKHELWVCVMVGDDGRAQTCDRAVAWITAAFKYGEYQVP